jgi:hypothetical protein
MHPQIKKYWEDVGYALDWDFIPSGSFDGGGKYWFAIRDDIACPDIIAATYATGETVYYFNRKMYPEELALKVIKLKSFI